ncbi:helix-turn-helix transcriptional regulator [Heyndrickxia acidicola]|uniref:Helix-turn-helix domain-containing protein n=1 Tax=Heyndrickxia acidicola TaxID=209389 RepID=A0ABU6MH25_9BACI|nr:helix-turn-helix domain-containing protein [Heyndrickxia acidicola]MED1202577.1 helix-turn-helix domain-containing protein [Heyndrickxia acidicola]
MTYKTQEELPLFLTAHDISNLLSVSEPTSYKIMKQEGFPLIKFVGCRSMRVKRDDFFEWLNSVKGNLK